jgi:hypothetical protein
VADSVTWTGASNNTWADGDSSNWSGGDGTYNDGDDATFGNSGSNTDPISISGTVAPGSMTFNNSVTYELNNGTISGTGGLSKQNSGLLDIRATGGLAVETAFSGDTTISGGTLRSYGAVQDADNVLDVGTGTLVIENGATFLTRAANGYGGSNGVTVGQDMQTGAGGGTIDINVPQRLRDGWSHTGTLTLGGDLTVDPDGQDISGGISFSRLELTSNAQLTVSGNLGDLRGFTIGEVVSSSTSSLTLSGQGNDASFFIPMTSTNELNVANLTVDGTLSIDTFDNGIDPFDQIQANGGTVTVADGGALTLKGNKNNPLKIDPTAISWAGNGTLNLTSASSTSGNKDRDWDIVGDLTVGGGTGLDHIDYNPRRGALTVTAGNTLTIGSGGMLDCFQNSSRLDERISGDLTVLDGGVIQGRNTITGGGLASGGGTMTLGDGTPGTVTIRGDHDASDTVFVMGYGNDLTVTSETTVRYESTGTTSGHYFNVAWTGTGPPDGFPAPLQFNATHGEGTAATEFAPEPGGATVAIVGPSSGDAAVLSGSATVTTAGTTGFYNYGESGTRGNLAPITVAGGGSFTVEEDGGTARAAAITVESGGTLAGNGTFEVTDAGLDALGISGTVSPGTSVGTLTFDGNATFQPGSELIIELQSLTSYDVLEIVDGDLTLGGGTLRLTTLGGYTPEVDDRFEFLEGNILSGQFDTLDLPTLPGDMEWVTTDLYTGGALSVTPEPGAALLLLCGVLGLLLRRGRK